MFGLQPVTVATIGAAFVFGMVLALLGSLKLALASRLDLGEGKVGGLFAALNLALIPMMILSGMFVDRGSVTFALVAGSIVTALALFGLGLRPSYGQAFFSLMLAGLGSAAISTASIVLMPRAFFGTEKMAASLNIGNVFFALGALVTPPLTGLLLHKFEWRKTLGVLAVICLVPALLAVLASRQLAELAPTTGASLADVWAQGTVWLAALVFLVYAPLEGAISVWATTLATDTGVSEKRAAWMLSGFWAAFLLSRLLVAYAEYAGVISNRWDPWLVAVPPLLVAALLGNLTGVHDARRAWKGLLGLGFLLGPIFPTLLAMLFGRLEQNGLNANGSAYGTVYATGSLASLLVAPLIGAAARRRSLRVAMGIPMFLAILLTAMALMFWLARPSA